MQVGINEAASHLGISPNTVRRRLTNGLLTGTKMGNRWVIDVPDVDGVGQDIDGQRQTIDHGELLQFLMGQLSEKDQQITWLRERLDQVQTSLPSPRSRPHRLKRIWNALTNGTGGIS